MLLKNNDIGDILCDVAWTSEVELHDHFWYAGGKDIIILEMPLYEYMKRHYKEVHPMNEFAALGRFEFTDAWQTMWEKEIFEYQKHREER